MIYNMILDQSYTTGATIVELELRILPAAPKLISFSFLCRVRVVQSLMFCVVLLYHCLFFFNLWLLMNSVVFQQYFNYFDTVSSIGGENRYTPCKPDLSQIIDKLSR